MTGQATWITLAMWLFGGVGIALLVFAAARIGALLRASRKTVTCPVHGQQVRTVALQHIDGRWVDIARCDLLPDPDRVTCKKACLAGLNRA